MDIISRREAHSKGLTRFYTGRPCKYGHLSLRSVANGGCVQCANYVKVGASASNAAMPPTAYLFPKGITITPALVAEVHKKVLALVPKLVNDIERETGRFLMSPTLYLMTSLSGGASRNDMIAAGWTDAQLLATGMMVDAYDHRGDRITQEAADRLGVERAATYPPLGSPP